MTALASAASAFRRSQPPIAGAEATAANGALLSGTLQRAVKAVFAQYIAQLARALQLRQGVVATAVVRLTARRSLPEPLLSLHADTCRRSFGAFTRGTASRRMTRVKSRPPACS